MLLGSIPYAGGFIILVFMCLEGTRGPNRFGPDPKDLEGRYPVARFGDPAIDPLPRRPRPTARCEGGQQACRRAGPPLTPRLRAPVVELVDAPDSRRGLFSSRRVFSVS